MGGPLLRVDHGHYDALGADVECVADLILVVIPHSDDGDGFLAPHGSELMLQLLDLHGSVLGVEEKEIESCIG
ncbi:hypothetical protein ES705_40901 [subsurface metagenome]